MSNLRLPQGSGAGGDAGGHNELEEVPNIYQLLNQHPPELWKIFVAINISYNVAETNNSKDKYKYKYKYPTPLAEPAKRAFHWRGVVH